MHSERRQRLERWLKRPIVDTTVMVMILVSVVLLLLVVWLPDGSTEQRRMMIAGDVLTALFVVELSLRWMASPSPRAFWERYWLDCIAVIPTFRVFRILWLLRLLRLFRFGILFSRRLSGYSAILRNGAMETVAFLLVLGGLVLAGGVGIRLAEGETMGFNSLQSSLWWSILSLVAGEPVGGTPETNVGKVVTLTVMVCGLMLFATVTGIVSANMVERLRRINVRKLQLEDLEEHVIVCGWSPAGIRIIEELQADREHRKSGIVVIAEFESEPILEREQVPEPGLVYFVAGDYTRPDVLNRCRITAASRAIILADRTRERSDQDRDARSVLTALLIENINSEHGRNINTSVELVNPDNRQSLEQAGVEEIVVAHDYAGKILAASSRNQGLTAIIEELLTARYGNQFFKVTLPEQLPGMSVGELNERLRKRTRAILVAIEYPVGGEIEVQVNPADEERICGGDAAVVICQDQFDPNVLL